MPANYYEILGLDRNATYEAIRRAYRRLALELHPDRNDTPDAEERFKEINEAYQVLSVERTRIGYDRFIERQEEESERRQREAEQSRQREERVRRAAEERRRQAEAERLRREEAEQRQREAEQRRQREERVRRIAEERYRRQAEERLREAADQPEVSDPREESRPEENVEVVTTALVVTRLSPAPPVVGRNAWFVGRAVAASVAALLVLATGIFGVVYLLISTTATPDSVIQPTPDLGATIAAVAPARPTAAPTQPPATAVPSASVTPAPGRTVATAVPLIMPTFAPPLALIPTFVPIVAPTPPLAVPVVAPTPPLAVPIVAPTPAPSPVFVADSPGQPRDFRKIHGTGNTLYLKWKEPQYDGGAPIVHYHLAINGPGLEFSVTTAARGFPHPDIGTVPEFASGITYDVSLTACNSSRCSEPVTLLVNAEPIVPTSTPSNLLDPPGPVRNIRIFGSTSDHVELVWEPPASSGGSPVEEYLVMLKSRYDTRTEWVIAPYIQFSELTYDNQYVVEIMAVNKLHDGPFTTFKFSTHLNEPITTP